MPNYSTAQLKAMAAAAARANGIPVNILDAQVNQESGWQTNVGSPAGAEGIAQIVPKWHPGVDPYDPRAALNFMAREDANNLHKYGNWNDALSVYNSGRPWSVGQGFGETNHYVHSILGAAGASPTITPSTHPAPASPGAPAGTGGLIGGGIQGLLAQQLLSQISGGQPLTPSSVLGLAMMRNQLGQAQQTYGPTPTTQPLVPQGTRVVGGKHPYVMPVPGAAVNHLDQGIDYQGTPGQYVRAIGNARVDAVKADPGGFGTAVYYTLTSGPDAGKQIYVGHAAADVKPGQTVAAGAPVATLLQHPLGNATQPGWTEIGFANNGAPASGGGMNTPAAQAFQQFLNSIGG